MGRKPRIHYPGAVYHVIIRGNNRETVLFDEQHKRKYLSIVALYKDKLGFKLYAFCIMNNHAHLLIEVHDVPLSNIMQRVQQVYTQWFNCKYDRIGHVFQQRYKALLCDKESYLLQLIRYIHHNPVKAKLEGGIDYKWSSHAYYVGKEKGSLVDTDVLGMFAESRREALKQYLLFMNQDPDEIIEEIIYKNIDKLRPKIQAVERENADNKKRLNIDEIIEQVCMNENIGVSEITRRTRTQRISDIRKAIVLLSERYCNIMNKELAEKLNLSPSMVSKIKSGQNKGTAYVQDVIRRWEEVRK